MIESPEKILDEDEDGAGEINIDDMLERVRRAGAVHPFAERPEHHTTHGSIKYDPTKA